MKQRIHHQLRNTAITDNGVVCAQVTYDPSMWSSRKKNLLIDALRSGIATCGHATSDLVATLARSNNANVTQVTRWWGTVCAEDINPDKLEDLRAYTAAWIKMEIAAGSSSPRSWGSAHFMKDLDRGLKPNDIPLNHGMTSTERAAFIREYLVLPGEDETKRREDLIRMIQDNTPITITIT